MVSKDVIIPENIVGIGKNAFKDNDSIEKVELKSKINFVDDFAFCGCKKLESINLENICERIGISAFAGTGIEDVNVNARFIDDNAFRSSAFVEKRIKHVSIGSNTRKIGKFAFFRNEIEELHIDEGLVEVGERCFDPLHTEPVLPNSLTNIGDDAFKKYVERKHFTNPGMDINTY